MISFILRPVTFLAAAIAAIFVARDAPNFTIIQMIVALVGIGAFWETLADRFGRKGKTREPL